MRPKGEEAVVHRWSLKQILQNTHCIQTAAASSKEVNNKRRKREDKKRVQELLEL